MDSLMSTIARIAYLHESVALEAWDIIRDRMERDPHQERVGWGQQAGRINLSDPVLYFTNRFKTLPIGYEEYEMRRRWTYYRRLLNFHLPIQVEAFRSAGSYEDKDLVDAIRDDAQRDTASKNAWQTTDSLCKQSAWDVAIRMSLPDVIDWFPAALTETNGYTFSAIAEYAGYLRAKSAIPSLADRATLPIQGPLQAYYSAIKALGLMGDTLAVDALLRVTVDSSRVPLDLVLSIATVTHDTRSFSKLLSALESNETSDGMWLACAAATERILAANYPLEATDRQRLNAIVARDAVQTKDGYNLIISALGFLEIDEDQVNILRSLADGSKMETVRNKTLQTLARWNKFEAPFMHAALGLSEDPNSTGSYFLPIIRNRRIGVSDSETPSMETIFTIAVLFSIEPPRYMPAVLDVMSKGSSQEVWQLLGPALHGENLPDEVVTYFAEFLASDRGPFLGEPGLEALRAARPNLIFEILAPDGTPSFRSDWKAAVVREYSRAVDCGADKNSAVNAFIPLLRDPVRLVRYRAGRGLSLIEGDALFDACSMLKESDNSQDRTWGIEAASWLLDERKFVSFLDSALVDREKSVRQSAQASLTDRKRRHRADYYCSKICDKAVSGPLDVWHYAQALEHSCDDDSAWRLEEAAACAEVQSSMRAWLYWQAKKIQDSWERKEREWSEPRLE